MDILNEVAIWYYGGGPAVTLRWVLVRDPQGQSAPILVAWTQTTKIRGTQS